MKQADVDTIIAAVRAEMEPLQARVAAIELRQATAEATLSALSSQAGSKGATAGGGMTSERADRIAKGMIDPIRDYFRRSTAGLVERVKALEARPALVDAGVWDQGKAYDAGAAVSHDGSLWIAQRCVLPGERPGDGSGAFRLGIKRGRDGRDAPR